MGDTQSAQRDGKEDAGEDTGGGRPQDSEDINVEEQLNRQQNNRQVFGLHGKSDDPLAELNDHLEDELIDDGCDTESALVSAREGVSDSYAAVDNRDTLLEDVQITDTDPHAETVLSEKEEAMNEINKGFRRFFSNIGLKLTVKKGADEKPAEVASDVPVPPNPEEEPRSPGETCNVANESMSKTSENVADHHMALDSADNESTTCPTVTDMTSEDIHENVEDKTTGSTEVDQGAAEATLVHADTEGVTVEVEPGTSSPQESAEEEVLSPIKVFFTTGIFSSLKKKKKTAEDEKEKHKTNDKELVDMDREEQGRQEEIEKNLGKAKDEVCPSAESAVVEEKQKTEEGIEEAIPEPAPTMNGHEIGEDLVNDNEGPLTSEEKAQSQSSPLQRLFSRTSFRIGSTKQQGRKDSTEHVPVHLPSSAGLAESLSEVSPEMAPEEVKKSEESAWETLKRLLTPKKFQKSPPLSNEEAVISSTPEEPKASEGEEIPDANTEESKKRKDSIVSWDALLCGSGNRRSRKSSYADEQKPRMEGDDNKPADESRHATDHDSSHEIDDNIASSPEQGGSNSEDEGSTWKSFKRLVTPKRKSRDGEETKEHTSDSEIIQDESSFSLKKFIPGRKKRRPSEKQEQVLSDKPEKEEHSDEEDSETPAIVPFHEFDIPETECQVITQAVIESQTPEGEDHKGQEDVTGQTTEEIAMGDSTPALPEKTKDTETVLENQITTTPGSMEEGDDLTEFVSKLQQLSDIPEEGLIEESVATLASFADDAARDDTIADIIEFTSEAVTAPEPVDITVEDETEMVSAVSRLTDSSKTSGNTTPVPADYDAKETDNLLHQVVESISVTADEAGSVSRHILETSIPKELTILKTHQTPDATFSSTGFIVEPSDAFDRDAEAEGFSDMTEAIYTQCLSEDTTEEFHTAAISVDEELEYISESQRKLYFPHKENKALTSAVLPQAEDVNVAEISINNQKKDNEQANDMAASGTDSHVEATIQTDNVALVQKNEALEDKNYQVKDSITDDEAQVQIDDMVDESETLTLTDACISMNSEEVSGAQADEMPATSETTPTEETVKVSELLSCEQMQDVPALSVGDEAQHELLVAPVEPEEVIIEADKGNSQLQPCSSVDIVQAEQGSVQDLESQSEDIPVQDPTVPNSSITSTKGEGKLLKRKRRRRKVAIEQMQHTPLETEKHTEILQDALVDGENQTAEVSGELQAETSIEETDVYFEESNGQVLEQKVMTGDSSVRDEEKHDEKESVTQPEQSLTKKDLATVENEPTEVPQHISVEEDGQPIEVRNELEKITSVHMTSVNHDVTISQAFEKKGIIEDNAECQAEKALPFSTKKIEKEAAEVSEPGLEEEDLVSVMNYPCEERRQVTDELEAISVASVISDVQLLEEQLITEDIAESQAEDAKSEVEKEAVIVSEQYCAEKEVASIENDPGDEPRQVQVQVMDDEFETLQSVKVSTVNSEARNVEVHEKQVLSEGSNTENALSSSTSEVEKEAAEVSEPCLEEEELVSITNYPCEEPGQVTDELETLTSQIVASVISDVQLLEEQLITEDIAESQAEEAKSEVEKEAVIVSEQYCAEKELASIENDPGDEPRQVQVTNYEFETSQSVQVSTVNSEVTNVEVDEMQKISEYIIGSNSENDTLITDEDEKETITQSAQSLLENEFVTVENDQREVPWQIQDSGPIIQVRNKLEKPKSVHVASVNCDASTVQSLKNQSFTEDNLDSLVENAFPTSRSEVAEQGLVDKELTFTENDCHVSQDILVQEDAPLTEVGKDLETLDQNVASLDSKVGVAKVLEKQVLTDDNAASQAENTLPLSVSEVKKEATTVSEHDVADKKLVSQENDPCDVLLVLENVLVQEDVKLTEVTVDLETLTSVHGGSLNADARIVEVHEKQVTSEDLGSNAENANSWIIVESENKTVEQSLAKELATVECDPIEEPQHISVTDDIQVTEVTKELEALTSAHEPSVDSNAAIIEVLEKQVVSGEIPEPDASTSVTAEVQTETWVLIEQALLEKAQPIIDGYPPEIPQQNVVKEHVEVSENPQQISVTDDVQVGEVTKELEASTSLHVPSVDSNAGVIEALERQVVSEALRSNVENASTLKTVEVEKERKRKKKEKRKKNKLVSGEPQHISFTDGEVPEITKKSEASVARRDSLEDEKEIHSEEQLLETELVTVESNLNQEPQHISATDVLDAEVTKDLEALTSLHVASVGSNAGIVEVLEPVLNEASILVTAEVENETGVLIEQNLGGPTVDDNLYDNVKESEAVKASTEFEVPPTDQIALLISDSSIVEDGCLCEDIQVSDVEKASASMSAEAEKEAAALIKHVLVENEQITVLEDPDEVPRQCTVKINDEFADIAKEFDGSTEVHIASIITGSTPQVLEKQDISENISASEDSVALVGPEPSHEVVSIGANEIDEPIEVETNQELVEDGAAMQNEAGAAMQEFTCGATYVETSMLENSNTEMPDSTEPLLDVVTTDKEHKETIEPVRILETYVQEDMIEMKEERKGDGEVKSSEEVGVTDSNEAMDVSCQVENEIENISTSLATEEEIIDEMDNVTAKELDQQVNQTQVPEELAKEESCVDEEPVSEVQIVVTPPTVEQEVTEMTQSEPSELGAQKVTENKSDASIERHPEILSGTEIENEEETSSIHVLATTDNVSIVKPKTDLDEIKIGLKKESGENVIEEDSSCSPEVLARKETTEAQEEQSYSSHVVTPSSMGIVVPEIIISSEKEPTIQKEVTELVTELRSEPVKQAQVSEVEVQVAEDEVPEIQMEGTEFQATEEEEQNIEITATKIKVTERSEGVVQAIEAIDIEETKAKLKKELYVHVIEDSSCSPQEVAVEEMMDAKQQQSHPSQVVTDVAANQEIEVTELVKELVSIPVASQADTDQVEIVFLSETVQCHTVVDPLETAPPPVAHIEQAERTLPPGQPVQSEVGVEAAKPVPRGEEELDQDIWLDAEEDVGKEEGAEQTETEPRESLKSQVESCKGDHQELKFLDTAKHAEEDSRPEEIQEKYELESEGEDFDFAMEDSDIMNQAETSLMCKEVD